MIGVTYFFSSAIYLLTAWMKFAVCTVRCPDWPTSTKPVWDAGIHVGTCYVIAEQTTAFWKIANEVCWLNDWRLFDVKTPEKNTFYTTLLKSLDKALALPSCFWMGLTETETEGEWVWTDGSTASFNLYDPDSNNGTDTYFDYCMRMCKAPTGNEYVWQPGNCNGGEGGQSGIICVTEGTPLYEEPKSSPVPDVQRRPQRKQQQFVVHRIESLSGYRLLSTPVKVTRVMDITTCARVCTTTTPAQCVIVNFLQQKWERALYSDLDVLTGEKERLRGWEVWRVG